MKRVMFALLLVLLATSVVAFEITLFPEARTIKSNESASFDVDVTNKLLTEELFEVFSNDVTWDIRTLEILRVGPGERLETKLVVRPLNINPGTYNIPINFRRSGSSDIQKKIITVNLKSAKPLQDVYLPAVRGVGYMDEKIDPRKGVQLKLSIENQNKRDLGQVLVKVRSNVINKDYSTSLGPREKKTLTFEAQLDPLTVPQEDILQMTIVVPDPQRAFQFDLEPIRYEITQYGSVIPRVKKDLKFFKRVEVTTLTNEANRELANVHRVPAGFFKRLFVTGIPKPLVEDGELVWETNLKPGENATLTVIYNYRPIFWLLFILSVLVLAYFWFRSPLVVYKRAKALRTDDHGITEIKVVVELVNRSRKVVRGVSVLDLIPNLVDVVHDARFVKPTTTKHHSKGTLLKWRLELMEPKEHRIFVYRAKTRLSILGGLTLPVAAAQFIVDNTKREAVSAKTIIKV